MVELQERDRYFGLLAPRTHNLITTGYSITISAWKAAGPGEQNGILVTRKVH
jgi:hypothetical protein